MKRKSKIDKDFIKKGAKDTTEADVARLLEEKAAVEQKIANSGGMKKYLKVVKEMFSMLNDYRKGNYKKVPWLTVSAIVFILLYVLNPFDLVPEFIPLVGYVDDLSVLAIGLSFVETDIHKYINWKHKDHLEPTEEML